MSTGGNQGGHPGGGSGIFRRARAPQSGGGRGGGEESREGERAPDPHDLELGETFASIPRGALRTPAAVAAAPLGSARPATATPTTPGR